MKIKIALFISLILEITQLTLAAEVKMAFGEKIPPFCFPETNSGIEIEVFREALAHKGHTLTPLYFPFSRITWAFKTKKVDAAMTDLGENLEKTIGAFYGEPAVYYDNVFISLKEKNIVIKKPSDLKKLKIVSFQGALARYPEWLSEANKNKKLREENNQEYQVLQLHNNRYDVALSDRSIYKYFHNRLKRTGAIEGKEVVEHRFVELNLNDYRPVFRDKKIRDDFNLGLKNMKKNGRLKAIYDKYLNESSLENGYLDFFHLHKTLSLNDIGQCRPLPI